jgi:hypothetical protein
MRFENEGMALWYDLPDTPIPRDTVSGTEDVTIAIGVSPPDASNRVGVLYRINRGAVRQVAAGIPRHIGNTQYFEVVLPAAIFRPGDVVRYVAVCRCVGRQVPRREEAEELPSMFQVAGTPAPSPQGPPLKIPDTLDEPALSSTLAQRLAGSPADGTTSGQDSAPEVIWVESGDEVLVHLDSTQVRMLDGALLVSVDLETDQTGRSPLVVILALGASGDPAGLMAVTDDLPRGNGVLAARWGQVFQTAVWASLLGLASDHASERGSSPMGIAVAPGALSLRVGPPLSAVALNTGGSTP